MNDIVAQTDPAAEICRLFSEIGVHARQTVEAALRIGQLLTLQKAKLGHGNFMPWVKGCVPFSHKTATDYMMLYRYQGAIRAKLESVTNFNLMDAYALAAEKRPASRRMLRRTETKALFHDHRNRPPEQPIIDAEIIAPQTNGPILMKNGLQYARMAIIQLEKIDQQDLEREEAFDMVISWIGERRAQWARKSSKGPRAPKQEKVTALLQHVEREQLLDWLMNIDGHCIQPPSFFLDMGFPERFVEEQKRSFPDATLPDGTIGEMDGVGELQAVIGLAEALGADTSGVMAMGEGSRARQYAQACLDVLDVNRPVTPPVRGRRA